VRNLAGSYRTWRATQSPTGGATNADKPA
jgi:hypothetical protein